LNYFGKINHIEEKEKAGLVSEADRESEKIIETFLKLHHPEVEFLGEEGSFLSTSAYTSHFVGARWILDPLDGTTNYIHQFPIFCISLALEIEGKIELGIVDMPMLNQTWTAQRGRGAFCNQTKLSVSKTKDFSSSLLATGFFPGEDENMSEQIRIFSLLVRQARGIRRAGAAAYDMALVGSGVFDLFWEKNLKPWDTAAGQLIVEEAGGTVKTYEGDNFNPFKPSVVAGNPFLVDKFLHEISKLK
jgi:myo-inositol-1(or 4)-monophosphatase